MSESNRYRVTEKGMIECTCGCGVKINPYDSGIPVIACVKNKTATIIRKVDVRESRKRARKTMLGITKIKRKKRRTRWAWES